MVYQSITRELIDSDLVYKNLVNRYMKRMAKSFNDQYYHEVSTEERLENMTLHKYDARIQERCEERKMKDTILLVFFELLR